MAFVNAKKVMRESSKTKVGILEKKITESSCMNIF
jgi:hypothetical protein